MEKGGGVDMGAAERTTAEPLENKVTRSIKVAHNNNNLCFCAIRFDLDPARVN